MNIFFEPPKYPLYMNNHPFYDRHIGINEADEARMLQKI